jgi:hypothetical protein
MKPACPRCNHLFVREEGFALGASVVNLIFGQIIAVGFLVISLAITLPDPPITKLVVLGVAVAISAWVGFLPFSKTIWAAIDLVMHGTMGSSYGESNRQPGMPLRHGEPMQSVSRVKTSISEDSAMVDSAMVDSAMVDSAMVDSAMVDSAMVDSPAVDPPSK